MIKLFEVQAGVVKPTEHCFVLPWLKRIMDEYPKEHIQIYAYLFYMSCRSAENPFFNRPLQNLEEEIIQYLQCEFDTEDPIIVMGLKKCKDLFETPTVRAYNGISKMLDNLAIYMETQTITDGRDGNITAIVNAAKNFDSIRKSFKGIAKDLEEEQSQRARGGANLSYDS